jgi:hypothetical protein
MAGHRIRLLSGRPAGFTALSLALVLVSVLILGLAAPTLAAADDDQNIVTPQRIIIQPPTGGQLTARI